MVRQAAPNQVATLSQRFATPSRPVARPKPRLTPYLQTTYRPPPFPTPQIGNRSFHPNVAGQASASAVAGPATVFDPELQPKGARWDGRWSDPSRWVGRFHRSRRHLPRRRAAEKRRKEVSFCFVSVSEHLSKNGSHPEKLVVLFGNRPVHGPLPRRSRGLDPALWAGAAVVSPLLFSPLERAYPQAGICLAEAAETWGNLGNLGTLPMFCGNLGKPGKPGDATHVLGFIGDR